MIELKNVSKLYNGIAVIDQLNYSFKAKQNTILLGASGSGKTTILRMLVGLLEPDQGDILLDHKKLKDFSRAELAEKMGYIIQSGGLFPHLTGIENILLPIKIHQRSFKEGQRIMEELMEVVNLKSHVVKRFPKEMSGGQRQRVALLRGLILNQEYMLLDEPLSALDPLIRQKLIVELRQAFRTLKKTVVWVTHDLNIAAKMGDEIILLNKGKIEQSDSFTNMSSNPNTSFVREFLESQIPREV